MMYYMDDDDEDLMNENWHSFLEEIPDLEKQMGYEFWRGVLAYTEGPSSSVDLAAVVDSVGYCTPKGFDEIMGQDFEYYIKALVLDACCGWISRNMDDSDDIDEKIFFYPEDLIRVVHLLSKRIVDSNTTIESLRYALDKLMEDKKGDSKDGCEN